MHQLSSLDAQFLGLESSKVYAHVGGLLIFDPSTASTGKLGIKEISGLIAERLHLVPPFRWRLIQVPLGLDHPYWTEDPAFDLGYHVRETAVPPPGDDRQLADTVARIWSHPLDRTHPMWEVYVIQGLQNGRVGLLIKMHHSAIDGLAYEHVLDTLLDSSPEGRDLAPPVDDSQPERLPGDVAMLARGLLGLPRQGLRGLSALPRTVANMTDVFGANTVPGHAVIARAASRLHSLRGHTANDVVLEITTATPPLTRFNGTISPHRRYAFGSLPFDRVKAIKNALGTTVNDVVLTLATTAIRNWLLAQDDLPDDPLVAVVPVAVRSQEERATFGNRIGIMFVPIPTDEPSPRERLMRLHVVMRNAKEHHNALPATLLNDASALLPPALASRAIRTAIGLMGRTSRPPANVIISNVPGPRSWRYCAGARMEAGYSVSLILDAVGLNITVISYRDRLDVAILSDREQVDDVWSLMERLHDALEELEVAVRAESAGGGDGCAAAARRRPTRR
jgi:WS/DGAT/MGAT family acyltransferase